MFKVGDKVRVINAEDSFYKNGDVGLVVDITPMSSRICHDVKVNGLVQGYFAEEIELVSTGQTNFQRISTLEKEVEALKAEVAALKIGGTIAKKATSTSAFIREGFAQTINGDKVIRRKELTANEKRKAIISEAKEFIAEYEKAANGFMVVHEGNGLLSKYGMIVKYEINASKRTVVSLLYHDSSGKLVGKGIAKCAPSDIFNSDIGKAISLGRALGLDVSKFEQAVQPTEVVVGHVARGNNTGRNYNVIKTESDRVIAKEHGGYYNGFTLQHQVTITNDTEAKY